MLEDAGHIYQVFQLIDDGEKAPKDARWFYRLENYQRLNPEVMTRGFIKSLVAGIGALLLAPLASHAASVVIDNCYDGDTCRTTTGERIRLACINTPELKGRMAEPVPATAARDYLRSLVEGRKVGIRRITTDRLGRTVAELFVDGMNVGQDLVRSGHADVYWRYTKPCPWTR